jgi:predicted Zn-dependent protease
LAQLLIADASVQEAVPHVEVLYKSRPQDPNVRLALLQCRELQGRLEESKQLVDALLKDDPNNVWALYYQGKLASEPTEKEKWFRKVLNIDPAFLPARYALHNSLQQQGRSKEAAAELRKYKNDAEDVKKLKKLLASMEKAPRNPDVLASLGKTLLRFDEQRALRFLSRALEADPDHTETHQILARFYESKNQPEKAAHHRKKAAKSLKAPKSSK